MAAASFALCVATLALWLGAARDGWERLWFEISPPASGRDEVRCARGELLISRLRCSYSGAPAAIDASVRQSLKTRDTRWKRSPPYWPERYWMPHFWRGSMTFPEGPAPGITEVGTRTEMVLPLWLPTFWRVA